MFAVGVVMALLTGVTATTVASTVPTPAEAVSKNPDLRGAAANPFFVYVEAGEWITASGTVGPNGQGLVKVTDPAGNVTNISAASNFFTQQATTDGVWQVSYDTAYQHGGWEIEVSSGSNGSGTYFPGRVWTEDYRMTDAQVDGGGDHRFWIMDDSGYQYLVDLYDYTGVNSSIIANSLGLTQGPECTSTFKSMEGSFLAHNSIAPDPDANPIADCGSMFRIFFEPPSADLPEKAFIKGVERWVSPPPMSITELVSADFDYEPGTSVTTPGAAAITTEVDPRFQGSYWIEIDADGDGNYTGPLDRRVQVAADGGGTYTYEFDGLDNNGDPFPTCTPISARLAFDRVGEMHLLQDDVEARGGIRVEKLNGPAVGDTTVYWDDTDLPFDRFNTINPPSTTDGTAGVDSTHGVHGWNYNGNSWGNNRVIDDWAYTPLEETFSDPFSFTTYCPQPDIEISKSSNFTADSAPGDVIEYSITATNTGDGAYTEDNPAVILDDISELFDDADFDVTSVSANRPGETGYVEPLISWEGPLDVGDTVTLTYEVTLKGGGDGELRNVAWSPEDPEDRDTPDCEPDDPRCDEVTNLLPKLTVEKTTSKDAFTGPGDTIEYTVTVANPGPGDFTVANPATMTDNLSDVLASGSVASVTPPAIGEASISGDELSWTGVLIAGQSVEIKYVVEYTATYENGQDSTLENTACVPERHLAQGAEACSSVETPGPILSQWKSVESDDDPVVAGSEVRYTVHFENSGDAPATVDAVDHLDFVLDDAEVTSLPEAENPLTVTQDGEKLLITGTLAPGQTATYTYVVTPAADGSRTDSTMSNFLTPEGEEPPGDGVCVPPDEERPDCTTTPVYGSMLLEKRGNGPSGEIPLAGAEFELTPDGGDAISVTDETTTGIYLVDGLAPGEYTLTETKAPSGYTLLAEDITFTVLPSGAIESGTTDSVRVEDDGDGTFRLIITDVSAFELPMSGGFGNLPWILGGLLLAGAALTTSLVRARGDQNTSATPA